MKYISLAASLDLMPEEWTNVIDVKVKDVYYKTLYSKTEMIERNMEKIINISSTADQKAAES